MAAQIIPIWCKYSQRVLLPEDPATSVYLRAIHNEKTLFLSSSGKRTLHELGINDGDEIMLGGVDIEKKKESYEDSIICGKSTKSKKKNGSKKKKKKTKPSSTPILTEEQLKAKEAFLEALIEELAGKKEVAMLLVVIIIKRLFVTLKMKTKCIL